MKMNINNFQSIRKSYKKLEKEMTINHKDSIQNRIYYSTKLV